MSDFGPALTDDQWNRIRQIVHDEALRARVAASFLPLYGPYAGRRDDRAGGQPVLYPASRSSLINA